MTAVIERPAQAADVVDHLLPEDAMRWKPGFPIARFAPADVVENARYAWDNSRQACLAALPEDFVCDFRDKLDEAAVAAIAGVLIVLWERRGFAVRFVAPDEMDTSDRPVADGIYYTTWDEAADRLDAHKLVEAAELNDELNGYVGAAA
jgi:hypothetical protein